MRRFVQKLFLFCVLLTLSLLLAAGCGKTDAGKTGPTVESGAAAALPSGLFLDSAPEGAQAITALKESASEGDEVVVHVIIGGRMEPLVEGRASAAIIDASLPNACTSEDDHCQTPWDYCCTPQEEITANLATLQVVDDEGRLLAADLAEKLPPMTVLTVRGVVGPRPDPQVLTINATGIYIETGTP
ncbi:MAG: hypothetical protein ACIAXF_00970 [Phycisphaerales bacterium JB063]